jgi:hypothetical protein
MGLVKARVRENNKYGTAPAGSIIEVEPEELVLAKHCLIGLEDEQAEKDETAKTEKAKRSQMDEAFNRGREAAIAARKASEDAAAILAARRADEAAARAAEAKKPKK